MESERFNEFERAVDSRRNELGSIRAREETERQQKIEKEQNLELARERLRQKCRDAAEFLKAQNIPTRRGKIRLGLNGGSPGMGTYIPATKFKDVVFPEGWILRKNTKGEAADVLTTDGKWLTIVSNNGPLGKTGDIVEFPYDRCNRYGIDDDGPYLTFSVDSYGEHPMGSYETELTNLVATVIAG